MAQNVSAAPKQASDANTQGLVICPAKDSAGNAYKIAFFGGTPVVQPGATGNVHTPTAGSTTAAYVNTTYDGSVGTSAYTIGDIVLALKNLGILAQ